MTASRNNRPGFWHRQLLRLDPERAHDLAIRALALASVTGVGLNLVRRRYARAAPAGLDQEIFGRRFSNPIGIAAGFDKNGRVATGLAALGFGFVEVGTVTPKAQAGNPKPRIFRHPDQRSLQNALGFNNVGMDAVHGRIAAGYPYSFPLGVNVGKNATTPLEDAESDYAALFGCFADCADYFVINVSSPNTPGLRDLQAPDRLAGLLELGGRLTERPVLVKLSPDLEIETSVALARSAVEAGAAGIIVTNTTIDYGSIPGAAKRGGLSGAVLKERSYEILRALATELFGETLLISVGGIDSGDEVFRRLRAGASLVQIYTALVYQGPELIRSALDRVVELMDRAGHASLSDTIGSDLEAG